MVTGPSVVARGSDCLGIPTHSVTTSVLILMHLKAIVYGARQHEDRRGMQLRISVQKGGGHSTGVMLTAHIGSLKGISSPGIHDPHRCDSV